MKITKHVYFYKTPELKDLITSSNTMVIADKKNQIVIDPGINLKNKWGSLYQEMKKDGLDIKKTTEVWFTHNHPDHVQLARNVINESGAKVSCHQLGRGILEARRPFLKMEIQHLKLAGKFYKLMFRSEKLNPELIKELGNILKFLKLKKIKIDRMFCGGEELSANGLKIYVFCLPGHAPDEIGFWIPREEVLIVGDLIHPLGSGKGGRSSFPVFNTFAANFEKARESIKKMLGIKNWSFLVLPILPKICRPRIMLPAHGEPVFGKKNIQQLFENLLANMEMAEKIAKKLLWERPDLVDFQLIIKLADRLSLLFPESVRTPDIEYEMQFAAFAILKNMGVIK